MPFTGIFDPEQLAVMSQVLDDYCIRHCIEPFSPDHVDASYLIVSLFYNGAQTVEELKVALDAAAVGDVRRYA